MKKNGLGLCIFLILLIVLAWGVFLGQGVSGSAKYNEELKNAENYSQQALYQKAIACYENAFQYKDNQKIRDLWIEAHKNAYEDQAIDVSTYSNALDQMCALYPDEPTYWENLIGLYLENESITKAYNTYKQTQKRGVSSDAIKAYEKTILYTFNVNGRTYTEYALNADDSHLLYNGTEWGVLDAAGEYTYECIYDYISPYSSDGHVLVVSANGQRVLDADMCIEAKLDIAYAKTGAYGDGLLPVCAESGSWQYLECATNSFVGGTYEQASNYMNGVAAVCKNGKWILIDTAGQQVGEVTFSDIKLHSNGDYLYDGVMIAAQNGEYGMYSATGKALNVFKAKDMDIYRGGDIAFADASGKWGFVNADGEMVIQAQYAQAKSFSGNMAAICIGEQWGFINSKGETAIDPQFLEVGYFTANGTCMVSIEEGYHSLLQLKFTK